MDGCGITTGSTALDAAILALIPVLTVLLQRMGLGWLFDKLKPAPKPEEQPAAFWGGAKQPAEVKAPIPVAFDWLSLLMLLIPMLLEAIKAFRAQTGREPTPKEVREIIKRVQDGEQRFTLVEELPDNDLESVGGGKLRLRSTLDGFDAAVRDIGSAARRGDEAFKNFNGMFKPIARL